MSEIYPTRYAGLCLGGPKDGQFMDSSHPQMECVVQLTALEPTKSYASLPLTRVEVGKTTYSYQPIVGFGYWISEDLRREARDKNPVEIVLLALGRGYRRP